MPKPENAMKIFQLLNKSNCRECGEKTCLAFAGKVFTGQKKLNECPNLNDITIKRFCGKIKHKNTIEQEYDTYIKMLKNNLTNINFATTAKKIGALFLGDKLTIEILGKKVSVDTNGNIYSDIHINSWVTVPLLSYILYSKGIPVSGNWVSFRELKGGNERYPLFKKRCEEAMKRVADTYTDLFADIIHIFSGKQVEKQFKSDISVVLYPLPQIPVMICYWLPEDCLESAINIFFDKTADKNLDIDSVFTLGTGLAQMFCKFALMHGFPNVSP